MSDNIWQTGNFGVGVNKGEIHTKNVGGMIINEAQSKSLTEAATEIQQLLNQLEKSYSTDTTTGKMAIATEAIRLIDSNPKLHQRVLSALKAGGIQAFAQFLNHPAASFVIGALEDWQKSKGE
jgi:ribosomal protein L28